MVTIKSAATRLPDGEVYTDRNHASIIHGLAMAGYARRTAGEQGFVTDTGLFVDRVEAAKIALAAGQIEKLRYSRTELFSEDLYEAGRV